ncbi:BolA family transcriptional regulator [Methylococcus sp. EFPC2]|uniref:BolA family protein n=1 Tax=Methylococcus sp. EFPC2 TaxID=2812648 RepID=UPI001967A935|nr:BolA family protein [Methylococcus sp. EFPC2]QSA97965.1 BolA family transcriptional regulator [Methylococcus sp. EFPC2]
MNPRAERICQLIQEALAPTHFELFDHSAAHAGHYAARESGGGHFYATIVSAAFAGKSPVQRHQLVYRALGEMMQSDIHALSIKAYTPSEYHTKEDQE